MTHRILTALAAPAAVVGACKQPDGKESWIDPVVGVRWIQPIGAKWAFVARADVGGLGVDYEDGEGSSRFLYDVLTTGPVAGMTFSF